MNLKQRLTEVNQVSSNRKRKSATEPILLLIAQATTETNGNVKWLIWIAGIGVTIVIGFLVALATRGL